MIEGIVTGYEPQFDFPAAPADPRTRYILATTPRSGSTWVSHLLWQTGALGAPLEYLNFLSGGPQGEAHADPARQAALMERAIRYRTSPNGVFGLKTFPVQLEQLMQANPALVDRVMRFMVPPNGRRLVVRLQRRHREAQAISMARAALSGRWRADQEGEGDAEPPFSAEAVREASTQIARQESRWDAMCADLLLDPLVMAYEDFLEDADAAIAKVAAYLGVDLAEAFGFAVPPVRRQRQSGARDWALQARKGEG